MKNTRFEKYLDYILNQNVHLILHFKHIKSINSFLFLSFAFFFFPFIYSLWTIIMWWGDIIMRFSTWNGKEYYASNPIYLGLTIFLLDTTIQLENDTK